MAADFFRAEDGSRSRSRSNSRSQSPSPSKSPGEDERDKHRHHHHHHHRRHRHRSREADDDRREHKRRKHHHKRDRTALASSSAATQQHDPPPRHAELPFQARALSYRHDLEAFMTLFAYYLDIQKGRDVHAMDERERRGRWKSFVHKWNRGELAEGWYDPEMFERVAREAAEAGDWEEAAPGAAQERAVSPAAGGYGDGGGRVPSGGDATPSGGANERDVGDEDVDDYGPPPPPGQSDALPGSHHRKGPGIPTMGDLALQREDAASAREQELADLRLARRADRAQQKERLDELVPRAEPGTRERRLEKRALVSEKMRGFKEARGEGGGVEEVADGDLMGSGGADDLRALRQAAAQQQRKKTERELRREAEARARMEEREEKLREWREREEEKMKGLKELAKARFG